MTTERIDIIVSEDGSRVVKRRIQEVGDAGREAGKGTNILRQALQGLASGVAIAVLSRLADTYTNMISRLRLVTTGTANLAAVNERLFASANKTRSSYEATVELFAKLSTGAKALGVSQQDLLDITETVNQAIQVSGATSTEAAGGLRQLGQAIASGTLRGDELNSILENMPRLGQAIAEGMGKSVGELRALGAEGKLTASAIISALKDQAPQIAAEFAQVQPTISSAFQVLTNNAVRFVGELDQASGISRALAAGLILLAENLDVVAAALVTVGVAMLAVYGPSLVAMLATATGAVRTFTLALLANPIGLIAVGLASAVVAVMAFGDSLKVVQDDLKTTADESISMKDIFFETFVVLGQQAWASANVMSQAWDESLTTATEKSSETKNSFAEMMKEMADNTRKEINFIVGIFVGSYRAITTVWSELPKMFKDIAITSANYLIDALETAINTVATLLVAGPLAPFVNGGRGLELINIPRLQNDAEGAARIVSGVVASIFREETGKDWVGNAIRGATENVRDRRRAAGGLNPAGPSSPLPTTDDAAAKKAAKDAEQALDILRRFNTETADATRLAGLDARQRRVTGDLLALENQLREKNYFLTEGMRTELQNSVETMYRAQDVAQQRDALMARLTEREYDYAVGLEALNQVVDRGAITQGRYNQELRELDYNRLAGDIDAAAGAARGLLSVQMEMADEASRVERAYTSQWDAMNGGVMDLRANVLALQQLMEDDPINSGRYALELQKVGIEALRMQIAMGEGGFIDTARAGLATLVSDYQGVMLGLTDSFGDFFQSFTDGFADSVGRAIVYGESLGDALGEVARGALAELISAFVKLGIQWLVTQAIGQSLQAAATAASVAQAATVAAAWAPAAAAVSLASYGANAVPASLGMASTFALSSMLSALGGMPGFKEGGWTGSGGVDKVAGVVHGQEFVVNSEATRRYRPELEAMNRGRPLSSYLASRSAPASPGSVELKVNVENYSSADIQVERVSRDEVRIIAREEARREAPVSVARALTDPSSQVSRALGQSTTVERRRS